MKKIIVVVFIIALVSPGAVAQDRDWASLWNAMNDEMKMEWFIGFLDGLALSLQASSLDGEEQPTNSQVVILRLLEAGTSRTEEFPLFMNVFYAISSNKKYPFMLAAMDSLKKMGQ